MIRVLHPSDQYRAIYTTLYRMTERHDLRRVRAAANDTTTTPGGAKPWGKHHAMTNKNSPISTATDAPQKAALSQSRLPSFSSPWAAAYSSQSPTVDDESEIWQEPAGFRRWIDDNGLTERSLTVLMCFAVLATFAAAGFMLWAM